MAKHRQQACSAADLLSGSVSLVFGLVPQFITVAPLGLGTMVSVHENDGQVLASLVCRPIQ